MIAPSQCRAARGLLGITQRDLAESSGVSLRTIAHFEGGERTPVPANQTALQSALEHAGVIFLDEDGDGVGVRLRKVKGRKR